MEYKNSNPRRQTKKQKRKKRSRLKKGFIAFLLIFILTVTLVALSLTVFFKIENLTVSGNTVYESSEILSNAGIKTGDNMFLILNSTVENRLKEKLPFVESIKLKRILPSKLEIVITEEEEYFCYPYAGRFFTASKENKVLAEYSSAPTGLVLMKVSGLSGVEIGKNITFTKSEENGYVSKLFAAFEKYNVTVTAVDVTDLLSIKATVENRIIVNFGGPTDIDGKTEYLAAMLKNVDKKKQGTINLSVWSDAKDKGYFVEGNLQ